MQVYRGMNIGTAKAGRDERAEVPHHLLDLLDPSEEGSVGWFQQQATDAMTSIASRDRPVILVGGTGLYHRAVIDGLTIPPQFPEVAAELEDEADTSRLHSRLRSLDPTAASRMEPSNRRRIVRALEVTIGTGMPFSSFGPGLEAYPETDVVQIGLRVNRNDLSERLGRRLADQMAAGFLDEVAELDARPEGWSRTAAQALGYRELLAHLREGRALEDCVAETFVRTRRFAVRQERWFGRDPRVHWIDVVPGRRSDMSEVVDAATSLWAGP
jgi:tRNA dimethylallyltransferase